MQRHHKQEMVRVLSEKIPTFGNRAIILFGHCNATEEMTDELLAHGITPAVILDNSTAKQGLLYKEISIVPTETIEKYTAENSVVLIATRFYADMAPQLRGLGYNGEIIQVVEYNTFAEYSLSDETVKRKTERMERGKATLEQIREQYPLEHLIICPNNALGDVYWAMAFLPEYLKKHSISEIAVIVIGNACRQVAEMFDVDKSVTLENSKKMDELVQATIYTRESNCIIAQHDRPYTDNIIKWLDKRFLSFIDYYKCAVYGLPNDTEPLPPYKFEPFENRQKIPKGKSVILSPYAKSVVEFPSEYWEEIAAEYSVKGFSVYTNVVDDEQPISETQPLNVPIAQMFRASEYAGTFIGIRSGLCDVLHTADCRKIVVFPDCYYSTTPHKVADFFALPGWEETIFQ
jgi:hypothetical protein